MKAFGRYGSLGLELLLSIAVGYYGGAWLDRKLGTRWIAFVGFLIGCYAGFRAMFKAAKSMQRDIENQERLERGEDPWAEKPKASDGGGGGARREESREEKTPDEHDKADKADKA